MNMALDVAGEADEFMKPADKNEEKIQYFSPQKTDQKQVFPEITLKKGTVSVANNFTVNVIDSSAFMSDLKQTT